MQYIFLTLHNLLAAEFLPLYAKTFTPSSKSLNHPAKIEADQMDYDSKSKTVSAIGNVKIEQNKTIVDADIVTYNQSTNKITASGNIAISEPDGTIIKASQIELIDNMQEGKIINPKAYFSDKSSAKAAAAVRINKDIIILKNADYTACPTCTTNPNKTPMWRIKSSSTTFDIKKERVKHKNAIFKFYDIPIIYTPYFSHATPNAKRRSGFLTPKYRNDSILGTVVATPFYYNISPNKDIILTPTLVSKESPLLEANFRHLIPSGKYDLSGSITNPDRVDANGLKVEGQDLRGHIEGKGEFNLAKNWKWGFNGKRTSDDTYLRKYFYSAEDTLRSTAYVDYIKDRNFIHAETITFQGLQEADRTGLTPLILPHIQSGWQSTPPKNGNYFGIDSDILSLTRTEGTDSHRLSTTAYYAMPYISNTGHVLEWKNSIRGDAYLVNNVSAQTMTENFNGTQTRIIPQTQLDWSYPLITYKDDYKVVVEPIAELIISPYGQNFAKIPNEDSQTVDFSDINLFSENHFYGLDRIEEGPRANYGLKANIDHHKYGYTNLLIGQSYRAKDNIYFDKNSGLHNSNSDIVGGAAYGYEKGVDLEYQFRLDSDTLESNSNLVHTSLRSKHIDYNIDYLSDNKSPDLLDPKREIIVIGGDLHINDQFTLSGSSNRDLNDRAWRAISTALRYQGKCVGFIISIGREFTRDRDAPPNTNIAFQISLRNLTD